MRFSTLNGSQIVTISSESSPISQCFQFNCTLLNNYNLSYLAELQKSRKCSHSINAMTSPVPARTSRFVLRYSNFINLSKLVCPSGILQKEKRRNYEHPFQESLLYMAFYCPSTIFRLCLKFCDCCMS